jgi:hypothetical protein
VLLFPKTPARRENQAAPAESRNFAAAGGAFGLNAKA